MIRATELEDMGLGVPKPAEAAAVEGGVGVGLHNKEEVKGLYLGAKPPRFQSRLTHCLPVWSEPSHSVPPCLRCAICKIEIVTVPKSLFIEMMK